VKVDPDRAWVMEVMARCERPLLRYVTSLVGAELAPDIVQEGFLELCKQDPRELEGRVGPWLFVVCRNRALDARRRSTRMQGATRAESLVDEAAGPEAMLERKEDMARLARVLEGLDERQREVVRLRFAGGLSYKEIAEITELTVTNVGFILHKALAHVRAELARSPAAQPQAVRSAS
jgi:RNA polymerase sigma-70 factor (ECF subfamily)